MPPPEGRSQRTALMPFIRELAPILVAIVVGVAAGQLLTVWLPEAVKPVAKELGLSFALALAIFQVLRVNRMTPDAFKAIVFQPALLKMVYMIAAILIFKGVLEDSGAVAMISQEMGRWAIPLMPITMLLPFMVGMISGITVAFVGATFPILITLVQSMGEGSYLLAYMILAICSGFAGVLRAPE